MSKSTPSRFSRSLQILSISVEVIGRNKRLLVFPAAIFAFNLVFVLFFLVPSGLLVLGVPLRELAHWGNLSHHVAQAMDHLGGPRTHPIEGWRWTSICSFAAVVYLLAMFLTTFSSVALYNEILKALAGEPVSVRSGLRFAASRTKAILAWSLFAGVVGILLKATEEQFGWLGRIVLGSVGIAWSASSAFVIPVIVREESANPVALLKRSAMTLRKTWGESVVAFVGIRLLSPVLVIIPAFVLLALACIYLLFAKLTVLILPLAVGWLLVLMLGKLFVDVCGDIYRCALYVYATEGVLPAPFPEDLQDAGWKVR